MAYTTTQLAALETALTSGNLEVRYGDKLVKYQSTADMRALRADMRGELIAAGLLADAPQRGVATVTEYSRD